MFQCYSSPAQPVELESWLIRLQWEHIYDLPQYICKSNGLLSLHCEFRSFRNNMADFCKWNSAFTLPRGSVLIFELITVAECQQFKMLYYLLFIPFLCHDLKLLTVQHWLHKHQSGPFESDHRSFGLKKAYYSNSVVSVMSQNIFEEQNHLWGSLTL